MISKTDSPKRSRDSARTPSSKKQKTQEPLFYEEEEILQKHMNVVPNHIRTLRALGYNFRDEKSNVLNEDEKFEDFTEVQQERVSNYLKKEIGQQIKNFWAWLCKSEVFIILRKNQHKFISNANFDNIKSFLDIDSCQTFKSVAKEHLSDTNNFELFLQIFQSEILGLFRVNYWSVNDTNEHSYNRLCELMVEIMTIVKEVVKINIDYDDDLKFQFYLSTYRFFTEAHAMKKNVEKNVDGFVEELDGY